MPTVPEAWGQHRPDAAAGQATHLKAHRGAEQRLQKPLRVEPTGQGGAQASSGYVRDDVMEQVWGQLTVPSRSPRTCLSRSLPQGQARRRPEISKEQKYSLLWQTQAPKRCFYKARTVTTCISRPTKSSDAYPYRNPAVSAGERERSPVEGQKSLHRGLNAELGFWVLWK